MADSLSHPLCTLKHVTHITGDRYAVVDNESVTRECYFVFLRAFLDFSTSLFCNLIVLSFENFSSSQHLANTTAKQVISRLWFPRRNDYEMYKNEKPTGEACKTTVFKCKICKFLTDLCWLSCLLKLPICKCLVYNAVIDVKSLVFQVCASFPLVWCSSF